MTNKVANLALDLELTNGMNTEYITYSGKKLDNIEYAELLVKEASEFQAENKHLSYETCLEQVINDDDTEIIEVLF